MENSSRELYQARIQAVIAFIQQNLDQPLNLEQLAQVGCFSPYHFHRIFTGAVGETPQDFVNRIRLERAANRLLKAPALTITEIALTCGFSSSATFSRSFKKHFGVTASEYARRPLEIPLPARPDLPLATYPALQAQIRRTDPMHIAYLINFNGYAINQICNTWNRLFRWAQARDLITPQTRVIGISLDDPLITPKEKCRYYACITVPENLPPDPTIGRMEIPALKCAVFSLTCLPEEIELAYRAIYHTWLPESGFQPDDFPCYDQYYQTPDTHPEGRYVLDICIPVRPL